MGELPSAARVLYLTGPERLELRREPVPPPGPGELLLAVEAATTCGTDLKVWRRGGHPRMLQSPARFGHEVAGTVAAVGSGVERWRAGDRVVVANSAPCGVCPACRGHHENLCGDLQYLNGAYADYLIVPARFAGRSVHPSPPGLDPALAALAEPLACVLHGAAVAGVDAPADTVVLGAGPIGLLFVAVLAGRGHRVVAADPNPHRLAVAIRLGAADTVEVARDAGDADRLRGAAAGALGPELVVEATGSPEGWEVAMAAVADGGTVELFGGCAPGTVVGCDTHRLHYSEITVRGAYHYRPASFVAALALLGERGADLSPLLSDECGLDGVSAALQRMARREVLKVAVRPALAGAARRADAAGRENP